MFGVEPAVPVDFSVVELESAVFLADCDVEVVRAGEDFVLESAEFVLFAYVVDLVDNGRYTLVLVHQDLGNQVFVLDILIAEVEVSDMTDLREARGDLSLVIFGEDGGDDIVVCPVCVVEVDGVGDHSNRVFLRKGSKSGGVRVRSAYLPFISTLESENMCGMGRM